MSRRTLIFVCSGLALAVPRAHAGGPLEVGTGTATVLTGDSYLWAHAFGDGLINLIGGEIRGFRDRRADGGSHATGISAVDTARIIMNSSWGGCCQCGPNGQEPEHTPHCMHILIHSPSSTLASTSARKLLR